MNNGNSAVLINCLDCGGQVSPNAKSCPHCGSQLFGKTQKVAAIFAGMSLLVLIPVVLFFACLFLLFMYVLFVRVVVNKNQNARRRPHGQWDYSYKN